MEKPETAKCWYARREGVIRGPFTAVDVSRYILLGRIKLDDELSEDQLSWQTAKTLTSMLPDEIWRLSSWSDYQRLIVSRMQADDRRKERRNPATTLEKDAGADKRSGIDRRIEDSILSLADYSFGASESNRLENKRPLRVGALVLTVVLATIVIVWLVPASR